MSESSPKAPKAKRTRTAAKPWKRVFFRFDTATDEVRSQEEEMEKGLEKIYAENSDLKEMQKGYSWWWVKWFVAISIGLCLLSGLAWWGFIVLQPHTQQDLVALRVEVQGPEEVTIGKETEYVITWKNASFQSIQDTELRLGIPPLLQVTYMDPWPIDRSTMSWKLGLVSPGSEGKIVLRGIPFGLIGDKTTLQAVLTAPDQGAVDIKDALSTKTLTMTSSVIQGEWTVPSRIVAGDEVEIALDLRNIGDVDLKDLDIALQYPEYFVLQASSTAASPTLINEHHQSLEKLAVDSTSTIRIRGAFTSGFSGEQGFIADIHQRSQDSAIALYHSSTSVAVLASDLSLQIIANGSSAGRTISPGDPVRVTLAYSNTSPDTLSDISLVLAFESMRDGVSATGTSFLDWKGIEDANSGTTSTRTRIQSIRYDKSSIPALASLKPGDRGTVDITLPTLSAITSVNDAVIRIVATGHIGKAGAQEVARSLSTQPIQLRYRSDVLFIGTARYYTEEGAPLGSGPLPPVVGEPTTYRVSWLLTKSLHGLDQLSVTTTLPDSVSFAGIKTKTEGDLVFTTSTRELRWTLSEMPQNMNMAEVSFDLTLVPQPLDSGRFAPLTKAMTFTARDLVLQEMIRQQSGSLTTDLEDDEGAKGKGVVKK